MKNERPAHRAVVTGAGLTLALLVTAAALAAGQRPGGAVAAADSPLTPRHAYRPPTDDAVGRTGKRGLVTINISGTVTGPGGSPVPEVWINVGSNQDWYETETDASGFYQATIETDGFMWFDVLPRLETRLVQFGYSKDGVTESFTQDFSLTAGHLLRLRLIGRDGQPLTDGNTWMSVQALLSTPPPGMYYFIPWNAEDQFYQTVLPPDIYYLLTHNEPQGYHATTAPFDLRTGDATTDMELNTTFVHPVPYEPPDASKISFGPVNDLGEVEITGEPGAVLPLAHVVLGNMNSTHQAHVISGGDGSFGATLYAPPGSAVLVRHGPASEAWRDVESHGEGLQRFPGTIIHRVHAHEAPAGWLPFAAVGGIGIVEAEGSPPTRGSVGAAWVMSGAIGKPAGHAGSDPDGSPLFVEKPTVAGSTLTFAPGESLEISATIRVTSQAITTTTDLSAVDISSQASLMMLYDQHGNPLGSENFAGSTRLTPTGFPIRSAERPMRDLGLHVPVTGLHHTGGHALEGQLIISGDVPADLPEGVYRPVLRIQCTGVPTSTAWLSGKVLENYRTFLHDEADLPPIVVAVSGVSETASPSPRRLIWRLLRDTPVQGTRGASAREDERIYQPASFIVAQGAAYMVPPVDERSGEPITYRLEPFLPMMSYSERRTPAPPLIPFDLPGGELRVTIREPDGDVRDLGCEAFSQSFMRTMTTRAGQELNSNSVQVADVYSLMTASDHFRVEFEDYGHHVITMTGTVEDIWGNAYEGGGTYDVWVAHSLDIDPGVLPGTPLAVGDPINPVVQVYPRVPAEVTLTVTHFPGSDPAQAVTTTIRGRANAYGTFSPSAHVLISARPGCRSACSDPLAAVVGEIDRDTPITLTAPGEYRIDLTAIYTDPAGEITMGAMTWGSVVMTPPDEAQLIAHGQRGVDVWDGIAPQWVLFNDQCVGSAHLYNPYRNGDIVWSRTSDEPCSGDSLILAATLEDPSLTIAPAIHARYNRMNPVIYGPWVDFETAISVGQIPTFSSTRSGMAPQMMPDDQDQILYSYQYSERPGVRVREDVTESGHQGCGYWRFDDLYDYQLGVGIEGDLPNDVKSQYLGVVFRDLESGHSEYLGHGSGWVHLTEEDELGSRVMPPFAGPGNGGWTTDGGPIMTLKGEPVHIFIMPTGVRPGAVLEVGDVFGFAGHIMPTLDSQVVVTVTAPGGTQRVITATANSVGYVYDPEDDFVVDEPGAWAVDVNVWHDGLCSGGQTLPPFPSGDVLGSEHGTWSGGRYWFYVVPSGASRLDVASPSPGSLSFDQGVTPVTITGIVPAGLTGAAIDYTISMPGFILAHGQVTPADGTYAVVFDPAALHDDFPNLDLTARDDHLPGLSDTFAIGLLLQSERGGEPVYRANTVTIQGEQVFVGETVLDRPYDVYLPLVLKNG